MSQRRAEIGLDRRGRFCCAAVEPLEGRVLLSSVTVNAAQVVRTVAPQLLGVNLATWDGQLSTSTTLTLSQNAGLDAVRLPGGSSSDTYHFNANPDGNQSMGQMAEYAANLGATAVVTIDYGTGSPQEGVALWAYLNGSPSDTTVIGNGEEYTGGKWVAENWQTVGYWASLRAAAPLATDDGQNFLRLSHPQPFNDTMWEVGNEEYGSWETDDHGKTDNTPAADQLVMPAGTKPAIHDPTTYIAFAKEFATQVRSIIAEESAAGDSVPPILIGIDSQSTSTSDFSDWIGNVLTQCKSQNFIPDFISDHIYDQSPGGENDATLLADPTTPQGSSASNTYDLAQRAQDYQKLINTYLGSEGANIQLLATEMNSVSSSPGKQSTSLVNGLFTADSLGSMMETPYNGAWIWALHNGEPSPDGNTSSSLYGWREYGDYGIIGNGSGAALNELSPDYFAEQLLSKIVQSGGTVVSATSDSSLLDTFAVLEPTGHLDLLVINKNPPSAGPPNNLPDPAITEQFNLQNFTPSGQATVWQYGVVQDDAQDTSGTAALSRQATSLGVSSGAFTLSIPDYSMSVIDLAPALSVSAAAMYLKLDSDGQHVDLWNNATGSGAYAQQLLPSQIGAMTITATAGSSGPFTFDLSNGNFLPTNAIKFIGTGADAIEVIGAGGNDTVAAGVNSLSINSATVNFSGTSTNTFDPHGGDDSLSLGNGANWQLAAPPIGSGDLVRQLSSLSIGLGADLQLADAAAGGERELVVISSLSIASSNNAPAAKLDLGENDVDVVGGDANTLGPDVASGLNLAAAAAGTGTLWQGQGICTSAATASNDMALGAIVNNNNGADIYGATASNGPFDSYDPASNDFLIRYTVNGDADLSGSITIADYLLIDDGFNRGLSGWLHGDFNYDGHINGDDYSLIDNAFNAQNVASAPSAATISKTPSNAASSLPAIGTQTAALRAAGSPPPALVEAPKTTTDGAAPAPLASMPRPGPGATTSLLADSALIVPAQTTNVGDSPLADQVLAALDGSDQ